VCKTKSFTLTITYLFPLLLYTLSSRRLHHSRPRARRTTCMCVCACYLRVFFILLQVRFFILFRSRTRHNIKRTHFSYHRHTTMYVRFRPFYSMCTTHHTRCYPTISDVLLIHDFIFSCCRVLYMYMYIIIIIIIIIKTTIGWRWVTAVEHGVVDGILFSFCTCAQTCRTYEIVLNDT
jgi:hypothetical protein